MSWTLVLEPSEKLATDEDGSLVPSNLKLAYELAVEFLREHKSLPTKPDGVTPQDWEQKSFKEALDSFLIKTLPVNRDKSSGSITIGLNDILIPDLLSYINLPGKISKNELNRHERRMEARS